MCDREWEKKRLRAARFKQQQQPQNATNWNGKYLWQLTICISICELVDNIGITETKLHYWLFIIIYLYIYSFSRDIDLMP